VYDTLADVYAFLVPDELLTPEGSAAAFAPVLEGVPPGARVLDCACGTGELAVGLALAGFDVAASDASTGMVARTHALAARHGVSVDVAQRRWDALEPSGDAAVVLCVGNSLVHAPGRDARRTALAAMAGALAPGGRLAVTSRGWEALRAARPGLEIGDRLVERNGVRALIVRNWAIPEHWEDEHGMDVAVAVLAGDGTVVTSAERLRLWPFRHEELLEDLAAAGLEVVSDGFAVDAGRYLVTARRV
jgi:SAM-dependent methyltransferase